MGLFFAVEPLGYQGAETSATELSGIFQLLDKEYVSNNMVMVKALLEVFLLKLSCPTFACHQEIYNNLNLEY
jgi:hypothetical protein